MLSRRVEESSRFSRFMRQLALSDSTSAAMERTSTKRSRSNPGGETDERWRRLLLKILYLVRPITELIIRLLARPDVPMEPIRESIPTSPASSTESHESWSKLTEDFGVPADYNPDFQERMDVYTDPKLKKEISRPPLCSCGVPCRLQQYTDGGMNHKRLFWMCDKRRGQGCQTMHWLNAQQFWYPTGLKIDSRKPGQALKDLNPKEIEQVRATCGHEKTTITGSNSYVHMERCIRCGHTLHREKKEPKREPKPKSASERSQNPKETVTKTDKPRLPRRPSRPRTRRTWRSSLPTGSGSSSGTGPGTAGPRVERAAARTTCRVCGRVLR